MSPGSRVLLSTLPREHGFVSGTVACVAALQCGLVIADLEAELVPMWCWPGVTQARAAVALARPGAETPGETLLRLLVVELDIGEPETQFPVRIGEGVAWTDLRVGCHVFEFDGRIKYRRAESGGVADRTKARLRAEYELTVARLGAVLPGHLARSAAEIRAQRPRRRAAS